MEKKMTPCEKLGYKVGDRFRVLNKSLQDIYGCKDVVSLSIDDGSHCPFFSDGERDPCCFGINDGDLEQISATTLKTGDEITQDGKKYHVTLGEIPQYEFKPGMVCVVDWSKAGAACVMHSSFQKVIYIGNRNEGVDKVAYATTSNILAIGYVNTSSLLPE